MTREELKQHCEKQVKACEMWAENRGQEPSGKVYEEHKLILDLINELQDKSYELWKESYEVEHARNIQLEEKIKLLEQQPSEDCVSRQAVLDLATTIQTDDYSGNEIIDVVEVDDIKALPPVTPTHGNCKDCKHNKKSHNAITLCYTTCDLGHRFELREPSTFYCADFEKRGDLDGSN